MYRVRKRWREGRRDRGRGGKRGEERRREGRREGEDERADPTIRVLNILYTLPNSFSFLFFDNI
jgi:hypothetical protein